MKIDGCCAVVTGGASGIGRSLAVELASRGARVVVIDRNVERAKVIAARVDGEARLCDVGSPDEVRDLVDSVERTVGPIDIYCSNAGMLDQGVGLDNTPDQLHRIVDVNLLAHVWAAQAVVPRMIARGGGRFLQTVSAAGLLTGPMDVGYAFTKHGALGFAEWLALNYADRGIRVTCLCPSAVNTGMTGRDEAAEDDAPDAPRPALAPNMLEPEHCATVAIDAMQAGQFLALPHPEVLERFRSKAADYDGWLVSMSNWLREFRLQDEEHVS